MIFSLALAGLSLALNPFAALAWLAKVAVYVLVLGTLIVIHELGHLVAAKRAGVAVEEFAFGFGPRLFGIDRGGTLYTVNLLPIGGFCRMRGEDTAADGSADPGNFQHKSLGARFLIIAAGPIANVVLAALLFGVLAVAIGQPTVTDVVAQVRPGTPAQAAGIAPGDEIVMVDGQSFRSGDELVDYIHARPNALLAVDVRHGPSIRHLHVKTMSQAIGDKPIGAIGFVPKQVYTRMGFGPGVLWALEMVPTTMALNAVGIAQVIAQHDASQLHGPIGIGAIVVQAEQGGISDVLTIAAELSVILGMFNLLPIPALDGGRLAFFVVELVRGRRVDPEKEGLVHLTGFALIMVFIAFVTYHDIAQLVSGKGPI